MFRHWSEIITIPSRIPIILICLLVLTVPLFYMSINKINEYRYHYFLEKALSGPAALIIKGLSDRLNEPKEWIKFVNLLSDLNWTLVDTVPAFAKPTLYNNLHYFDLDEKQHKGSIWWPTGRKFGKYLKVDVHGSEENLIQIFGLLIMNSIRTASGKEFDHIYNELNEILSFPIAKVDKNSVKMDLSAFKLVNSGLPAVVKIQNTNAISHSLLIPTNDPAYIIQFGPLSLYHWIPVFQAIYISILISIILSIFVLGLYRFQSRAMSAELTKGNAVNPVNSDTEVAKKEGVSSSLGASSRNLARNLEAALEKNKELIQTISHELKTPLARLRFRVEHIGQNEVDQKGLVHSMIHDLEQSEELVKELLFFHKLGSQQSEPSIEFNLEPIIEDIIEEASLIESNINFIIDIGPNVRMSGRLSDIRKLIKNLIENACKYGEDLVRIVAIVHNGYLQLAVDDNGKGIPVEEHKRVFEPFVRVPSDQGVKRAGTGLGLAICQRIVESHSGSIKLTLNNLGGCQFKVILPTQISRKVAEPGIA